jgi:hypothetical protein
MAARKSRKPKQDTPEQARIRAAEADIANHIEAVLLERLDQDPEYQSICVRGGERE